MSDFPGMVEVMGDQDADDIAGWESLSPIREPFTVQLVIVCKGANGVEPASMTFRQPGEELRART
jgi:hypothetical protein